MPVAIPIPTSRARLVEGALASLAESSIGARRRVVCQLSKIETFEPGWSMDSLPSIARALNISVASLLDENENPWRDYMERRFSRLEEKIDAVLDALRHNR